MNRFNSSTEELFSVSWGSSYIASKKNCREYSLIQFCPNKKSKCPPEEQDIHIIPWLINKIGEKFYKKNILLVSLFKKLSRKKNSGGPHFLYFNKSTMRENYLKNITFCWEFKKICVNPIFCFIKVLILKTKKKKNLHPFISLSQFTIEYLHQIIKIKRSSL